MAWLLSPSDHAPDAADPLAARRSRVLLDVALTALAMFGTLAQLRHGGINTAQPGAAQLDLLGSTLAVGGTLPLLGWRRWPRAVFVTTMAATLLLAGLDYPVDVHVGPAAALFLLAASRAEVTPWTVPATATVVGLFAAYLGAAAAAQGTFPVNELLHTGLAVTAAWFAGERTRLRREKTAELRRRAERAEREAEHERQLAVDQERTRIARDLHDSAGHAISLIAVRAGAARLGHAQAPDRSLVALEAIEDLARQTVTEIDQFVGTLRDHTPPNGSVDAPPGLASLDTLIAHHTATGLVVTIEHADPPQPLNGSADRAVYRILQEALTNAARHGDGTAMISLAYGDDALAVTVTNPVTETATGRPHPGGGHGVIGMRERARLIGGSVYACRTHDEFRVHARIPYEP